MLKKLIQIITEYYKDYRAQQVRYKKWQRKKKAFAKAKKLADLKHESSGNRFYVFEDKVDGGLLVMNRYQMKRIYTMTKRKFNFTDALYSTK